MSHQLTMVLLLFFLSLLPIFFLFLLSKWKKTAAMVHDHPPGPVGLPFIGNLHQLDYSNLHQYLCQLSKHYGPIMSLRLGSIPVVVISSAKMAKQVFKTHDLIFSSRPIMFGQKKLSYNNSDVAFSPYNDYWREMRKIFILHLLNSKRVQSFRPIREEEISHMIKKIIGLSSSSKITNLSEIIMSVTNNIICRIAFGKSYNEGYERNRFHRLLHEAQEMMASFFVSDYFPLFGWIDKLTGLYSRLEKNFKEMDIFYQELIDDHLDLKRPKSMQQDIIDILLQLKEDPLSSYDLSFDNIKAVLMNILIAGTDTVTATTVWVMTELIKNPRVMKKVQEEVRKLIGEKGKADENDLEKLVFLKAVVKETMRLHPAAPLLVPRETTEKCDIDNYEIQPKTVVYVNVWAIGRDEDSWKNPEEFLPERFMDSTIDFKGQDYELIPFGTGRRGCPAIYMGSMTVELLLANLLYSFDWDVPIGMKKEDIDTDVIPGLTMHKKNALCLLTRKRISVLV